MTVIWQLVLTSLDVDLTLDSEEGSEEVREGKTGSGREGWEEQRNRGDVRNRWSGGHDERWGRQ